jgi:NADPH-dependent curcumin reductase CurA
VAPHLAVVVQGSSERAEGRVAQVAIGADPDGRDQFVAVVDRAHDGSRVGVVPDVDRVERDGPRHYLMLLVARASMTGMLVLDYVDRYPEAVARLAGWLSSGELIAREDVVHGTVEDFPRVLRQLFTG